MTSAQLRHIVQETSPDLHALYQRDLEKILLLDAEDRKRAQDIFRWILFGVRPLTVRELSEAMLVNPDGKTEPVLDELPEPIEQDVIDFQILRLCGSLVTIRPDSELEDLENCTLQSVHYSVKKVHNGTVEDFDSFRRKGGKSILEGSLPHLPGGSPHHGSLLAFGTRS